MQEQDRIIKINIEEEMKSSYIDYSMSVIGARALPDVRDGFKPVHRRILYGMMELGNTSDKPYKKAARIVGEVLGKYHPHGDLSVYGALVRMAQDWAMRYPLVDGQGNFGSIDGDSAAAMRYTEARLKKIGEEMMQDLYKETVDFTNNFDDTLQEPTVMPTRIPNLLVNGASGIAVGMATNMPTHNLREVIDACVAYIDNNEIDVDGLMQYIKAPDFPTGGYIYGISGVRDAYETGRGRVVMRAKAEIESHPTHDKIVVTEIPYGVNKAELIKSIADLSNDKKIEGISNVNDETDREGMRIVIDIKRDANASVVLNKLYKMTMLQTSFGVNNVALVHGRPRLLNLKDLIKYFVEHRHEVAVLPLLHRPPVPHRLPPVARLKNSLSHIPPSFVIETKAVRHRGQGHFRGAVPALLRPGAAVRPRPVPQPPPGGGPGAGGVLPCLAVAAGRRSQLPGLAVPGAA